MSVNPSHNETVLVLASASPVQNVPVLDLEHKGNAD